MRWLTNRKIRRMADPAGGTLLVTGVNAAAPGYSRQTLRCAGVVQAPGLPPTAVEVRGSARTARWPQPGSELPVTVDRADPHRLVIRWEQIPSGRDQAIAQAEAAAFRMRTGIDPAVLAEAVGTLQRGQPAASDTAAAGEWQALAAAAEDLDDRPRPTPRA